MTHYLGTRGCSTNYPRRDGDGVTPCNHHRWHRLLLVFIFFFLFWGKFIPEPELLGNRSFQNREPGRFYCVDNHYAPKKRNKVSVLKVGRSLCTAEGIDVSRPQPYRADSFFFLFVTSPITLTPAGIKVKSQCQLKLLCFLYSYEACFKIKGELVSPGTVRSPDLCNQ